MNVIEKDELKKIQLDILQAVHDYCTNKRLDYSLACGTLLGAVRHKGFIPWDDDIDICMLRKDYDELEKIFPELLDGKYVFLTLGRSKEWNRPWGKVIDTRTVLYEDVNTNDGFGVGIDVFPMDDVYDNYRFILWKFRQHLLIYLWSIKQMVKDHKRNIFRNSIISITQLLLYFVSIRRLAVLVDRYAKKYNNLGLKDVIESCDDVNIDKSVKKEVFNSYVKLEFEGHLFKAIKGYDNYLKNTYGDYMKLPPEDKRVSHHSFHAYWK